MFVTEGGRKTQREKVELEFTRAQSRETVTIFGCLRVSWVALIEGRMLGKRKREACCLGSSADERRTRTMEGGGGEGGQPMLNDARRRRGDARKRGRGADSESGMMRD